MSLALHTTASNSVFDRLGAAIADFVQSWTLPVATEAHLAALPDHVLLDIGVDPRSVASRSLDVATAPNLLMSEATNASARVTSKS